MKQKIIGVIKKDTVLFAAMVLAVISAFFVTPSLNYVNYIDFRVLGILLSLMIIMAGLQKNGLFDAIGCRLLEKTKNTMQLSMVLVFLCFFSSMLITNDVALITFVPFAVMTMQKCGQEKFLIPVIVLQTLAANLGSMLTPIGNPQNLYLYHLADMKMREFIAVLLPYTIASAILLFLSVFFVCRKKESIASGGKITMQSGITAVENIGIRKEMFFRNVVYLFLFALSLMVVLRVLPYYAVLFAVVAAVFAMDRQVFKNVDYSLLLTFTAFFIFTGNMGQMEAVHDVLQKIVGGRETGIGIVVSQLISNVPAALLLSGFTSDYKKLLVGVNLGGLGTLIASMANLISYKIYVHRYNENKGKYFMCFTLANVGFLTVLLILYALLGC